MKYLILALFLLKFTSLSYSQNNCDKILDSYTREYVKTHSETDISWLSIVDQSNYKEFQKDFSFFYTDLFGGSFKDFSEKRNQIYKEEKYKESSNRSYEKIKSYLPDEAIRAWSNCMLNSNSPLIVFVEDYRKSGAMVLLKWDAPPGFSGELENVVIEVNNVTTFPEVLNDARSSKTINEGQIHAFFKRKDLEKWIVGTIKGESNGVNFSAKFEIPPVFKVKSLKKQKGIYMCSCRGAGGVKGVEFWGPKGEVCNNIPAWGKYSNECKFITKIGACTGQGGVKGVALWGPVGEDCAGMKGAWGRYGDRNAVDLVTKDQEIKVCYGLGKGNVLKRMHLWGPSTYNCGGFPDWGKYDKNCKKPQIK